MSDVYLIAEIGGNHDGDFDRAKECVRAARESGADAVKFQIYDPEKLCHESTPPLAILRGKYKSQRERFRSLVFTENQYRELAQLSRGLGIDFGASVFDIKTAQWVNPICDFVKIASGDLTNTPLLSCAASSGKDVVVSTGMSQTEEIDRAVKMFDLGKLALLHCVSLYPAPAPSLHLSNIAFLKEKYPDITVGYSDHYAGIDACLYAVAAGARMIEKHFTWNKDIPYGDHALSCDQEDMARLKEKISEVLIMKGPDGFHRDDRELKNRENFRRGVYAARDLRQGAVIREDDVVLLRPPSGIEPEKFSQLIGKRLLRNLSKEEAFSWSDVQSPKKEES